MQLVLSICGIYGVVTGLLFAILCEAEVVFWQILKLLNLYHLTQNNLGIVKKEWETEGLG